MRGDACACVCAPQALVHVARELHVTLRHDLLHKHTHTMHTRARTRQRKLSAQIVARPQLTETMPK
jgi:hypothetical protein